MRVLLQAALDRLIDERRRGESLLILFDFDGTLSPFASLPAEAKLPPPVHDMLSMLGGMPQVLAGVVSSRGLSDLKEHVQIPTLVFAGSSGLELEFQGELHFPENGERWQHILASIATVATPVIAMFSSAWIERKRWALALHYRHVSPERHDEFRRAAREMLAPFGNLVRSVDSAMAIEVVPELGRSKGSAVEFAQRLLPARPDLTLYAGDEANDAEALEAVARGAGVAIGVGPHAPSAAQYRLSDPPALWDVMAYLCRGLSGLKGHGLGMTNDECRMSKE